MDVPEENRSYSSVKGTAQSSLSGQGWSADITGTKCDDQWVQLDLGEQMLVNGVVTMPHSNNDYVERYTISHSMTANVDDWWQVNGNFTFQEDASYQYYGQLLALFSPVVARYVRIYPQAAKGSVSMRAAALILKGMTRLTTKVTTIFHLRLCTVHKCYSVEYYTSYPRTRSPDHR